MTQLGFSSVKGAASWFAVCLTLALGFVGPVQAGDVFTVTNLVTNDQTANPAKITDAALVNAWGISHSSGSPFWVSDNGMHLSTLYMVDPITNTTSKFAPLPQVSIPGDGSVTGQAFANVAGSFNSNTFLFVSEDGTISGWRNTLGTQAEILQSPSPDNVYKGTTLDTTGGHSYLLSANFHAGKIDVFKGVSGSPDLAGNFTDPGLPANYAPFNIQILGGKVYVTYALQGAGNDEQHGAGLGIVSVFDANGNFIARIANNGGTLNAPWGLAIAPSGWGKFAGDLLVGNFGDGRINVFDQTKTDAFLGQLSDASSQPIVIDGLWGLIPGNNGNAGSSQNIYFSAGPNDEKNGLFGAIGVPEPSAAVLGLIAVGVLTGGWRWKSRSRSAKS
jgi:uncharacterized protein (TIGR03118 family)